MAQLCYSNSRKYRYRSDDDDYYESNKLEEAKKLEIVKRYVAKQLHSALKLEDCLSNRNKFTSSATQKDVYQVGIGGFASLSDFKYTCYSEGIKEALTGCHLSESEIDFLLYDSAKTNEHTEAHLQKLKSINERLLIRQQFLAENETSSNQCETESYPPVPINHPINFLPQLEAHLFPQMAKKNDEARNNESPRHRKRRKRVCNGSSILNQSTPIENNIIRSDKDILITDKKTTFWDVKEMAIKTLPNIRSAVNSNANDKLLNCSSVANDACRPRPSEGKLVVTVKQQPVTAPNFSKPFVWTMGDSKLTPISVIDKNKLDINIIKQDDKFKNYCCGVPSTTLYVKNLSRIVTPEKIVSIFGNFEKDNGSKIEYRILDGKMKGQAFVKFRDLRISTLALSICNGYILEGKPIIIEYGKR